MEGKKRKEKESGNLWKLGRILVCFFFKSYSDHYNQFFHYNQMMILFFFQFCSYLSFSTCSYVSLIWIKGYEMFSVTC